MTEVALQLNMKVLLNLIIEGSVEGKNYTERTRLVYI